MLSLLRNRAFWIGAMAPVALATGLLAYGASRGAGASKVGAHAAVSRGHRASVRIGEAASSVSALSTTPAVALPASLSNAVPGIDDPGPQVSSSLAVGTIDPSQAHLLLSEVGSLSASVYAAATSRGDVCVFVTGGPAGCADRFDSAAPVAWVGVVSPSTGAVSQIAGLAPDDVRSIAFDEGRTTQQAILRNNAFYVEPSAYPDAIIVTTVDGTTHVVGLPSQQQLKH